MRALVRSPLFILVAFEAVVVGIAFGIFRVALLEVEGKIDFNFVALSLASIFAALGCFFVMACSEIFDSSDNVHSRSSQRSLSKYFEKFESLWILALILVIAALYFLCDYLLDLVYNYGLNYE